MIAFAGTQRKASDMARSSKWCRKCRRTTRDVQVREISKLVPAPANCSHREHRPAGRCSLCEWRLNGPPRKIGRSKFLACEVPMRLPLAVLAACLLGLTAYAQPKAEPPKTEAPPPLDAGASVYAKVVRSTALVQSDR